MPRRFSFYGVFLLYAFIPFIFVILNTHRVLRKIFGPKRDEVTGEWRKLHNKELHDLYSSPSVIRIIKPKRRDGQGM
jgi:hypothetical protein